MNLDNVKKFAQYFSGFEDNYVLIGGNAAALLSERAGFDFRATQDFDVVLIVENMNDSFAQRLWQYIGDAGYLELEYSADDTHNFYRFKKKVNGNDGFPKLLELFSRVPAGIELTNFDNKTPIHISDDIQSLSALVLDDNYYAMLKTGNTIVENVHIIDLPQLMAFKAKAWLDLSKRKAQGEQVHSRDIAKHLKDLFNLDGALPNELVMVNVAEVVRKDMQLFVDEIRLEAIDPVAHGNNDLSIDDFIQDFTDMFGVE